MRKLKRDKNLEISLTIKGEEFINPPTESQRNAVLNKAMNEFSSDLHTLDALTSRFVAGSTNTSLEDRTQADLSDAEIMEDWQIPVMDKMAEAVTASNGDILEIGFGRGIASTMIQERGVRSHTIIECNDKVVKTFCDWQELFKDREIHLVHGLWQDTIAELGSFDGIFFHTYPLNEKEYLEYIQGKVSFAEHFVETAAKHLRPGGVFTYFSNEIDSLSRAHQRMLFKYFSSIEIKVIDLVLPEHVADTWWADSIVIVKAIK